VKDRCNSVDVALVVNHINFVLCEFFSFACSSPFCISQVLGILFLFLTAIRVTISVMAEL
jgi:hypothetical protein